MADDGEILARVERVFERNTAAFDRNTGAFERNSAVLDATLERLDRSEDDHKEFMREMMLRFEKLDERIWTGSSGWARVGPRATRPDSSGRARG